MQYEFSTWQARHLRQPLIPALAAATRALRRRWAWALLAAVVLVLLMAGLLQVLQTAVQQGDALRATTRQQGEDFWRCNALPTAADRHACRHQSLQPAAPAPQTSPAPKLML